MKLFRLFSLPSLASVMLLGLALTACTTAGGSVPLPGGDGSTAPPIVSTDGTLADERALFAVEAAYYVAATAYVSADDRGLIPGPTRERARQALVTSYQALNLARTAYRAGDSPTFSAQAAEALRFATQARDLIPK